MVRHCYIGMQLRTVEKNITLTETVSGIALKVQEMLVRKPVMEDRFKRL